MPNLARYSHIHACELSKKVILIHLGQKAYSSLFLCVFLDQADKILKAERPGSE